MHLSAVESCACSPPWLDFVGESSKSLGETLHYVPRIVTQPMAWMEHFRAGQIRCQFRRLDHGANQGRGTKHYRDAGRMRWQRITTGPSSRWKRNGGLITLRRAR